MKVTSENYVELAVKTESPITVEMKTRLLTVLPQFEDLIREQIVLGNKLDFLKKYIFYGKGTPDQDSRPNEESSAERAANDLVIRLIHSIVGITTEATELFEALYKHIVEGKKLDLVNLKEEYGDQAWYFALGLDTIKANMNDTLQINIEKLAARYPDKFSESAAINRDLETERKILEQ